MVKRGMTVLLIILSIAVFLPSLPYIEIVSGHEAREGMRLREMLETGHWLFPEVLRKPPLYYWLSGIIAQLRGGTVDAISLRLPSALLAGLGVLVVFGFGRHAAARGGGAWAGVILLTSLLYVQHGHNSRTDMALCFFVTGSLLLFFFAYTRFWRHGRGGDWVPYLFACCLALALLSKGPVGVILVLLPIVAFLVWRRDLSGAWPLLRPGPILTFGVLGCGWYLSALWGAGEEFWHTQIMEENVSRFVGGIDKMSVFYYVGPLLFMFAPWNFFLPAALWRAFKEKEEGPVFLALWWLAVVLFFQMSAYKRARYLLPAQPASSLLVGWWLTTRLSAMTATAQRWRWRKHGIGLLAVLAAVAAAVGLLALWGAQEKGPLSCSQLFSFFARETQEQIALYCHWLAQHLLAGLAWWGLMALCFFFFLRFLAQVRLDGALVSLSLALLLIYTGLYPSWLAVTSWAESPQGYVNNIVEKIGPERQVAFINPCADQGFTILFALQERARVTEVQWPWEASQPPPLPTGYYLVSDERRAEVTSRAAGTWSEVLRDTGPLGWPLTLFFYTAP
jgi:4-amino-4-deoxy-L-arabinose transferase-like glycosyltransferase